MSSTTAQSARLHKLWCHISSCYMRAVPCRSAAPVVNKPTQSQMLPTWNYCRLVHKLCTCPAAAAGAAADLCCQHTTCALLGTAIRKSGNCAFTARAAKRVKGRELHVLQPQLQQLRAAATTAALCSSAPMSLVWNFSGAVPQRPAD